MTDDLEIPRFLRITAMLEIPRFLRITAMTQLEKRLARKGSFMMLTHGEGYSTDDGRTVDARIARKHIAQGDLFEEAGAYYKPQVLPLYGNEDGLFPGMSQTWVLGDA